MRMPTWFVISTVVLAVAGIAAPAAEPGKEPRREIKWSNPPGPTLSGVEHRSFRSASMDVEVGYNVALPAGYAQGQKRYPVIYFLHGSGGNENSDVGGFSRLVARITAEKKLPPAICVFPNGGMSGYRDIPDQKIMGETMIVKELIPLIDKTCRTQPSREGRVIAGFSMGASGAIRLAFKYPDLFSAAGSWAGAGGSRGGLPPAQLEPDNLRRLAGRVRLLMIVGDQDMTYSTYKPLLKNLDEVKYPYRFRVVEGVGHNLGLLFEKTGEEMVLFLTLSPGGQAGE